MSFGGTGSSSSGSIHGSSDVALSNPGDGQVLTYSGSLAKWMNQLIGTTVLSTQHTAAYTLALTDAGTTVELNSGAAVVVSVPVSTSVAFPVGSIIEICQYGLGQVSLQATSGVQLLTPASLNTRTQYSTVALRMRATDEWIVSGDLAP